MTTPQHHIIKETSDSLGRLLQDEFKRAGYKRVHLVEEPPKPEAVEGKLPAVSVYLYQVSLDSEGVDGHVHSELVREERDDGTVEEYSRRRRIWVRLDYLISTWAQTAEDEQLLLGLAIRAIMDNPTVARERLRGDAFDDDHELFVVLSTRLDEGTLARFWGSLGQPIRPAIQAWTAIPIVPEKMEPLTRVTERALSFRDLNEPSQASEDGPVREVYSRRHRVPAGDDET